MLKLYSASFAAALLAGMAAPALAQTTASAAPAATEKPKNSADEIICEKKEATGSRIGAKRVCMTRAQWAERQLQDRQELDRVQIQRGTKGE
jgi:invasion protein IalB